MHHNPSAHSLWMSPGTALPACERLRKAVAALIRARHRQRLLAYGSVGLLAGFGLATIVVLVCRLLPLHYPAWPLAAAAILLALVVALVAGWWRRPDALEVAIRADIALRLKQRLSTAWECLSIHGDGDLSNRLAQQAVAAGLPLHPEWVFPLRLNRWARLAPLAAIVLLLASVLDLERMQAPAADEVNEQVVGEGRRLGAFARAMQARALRDQLPHSAAQAAQLERLGASMQSGALPRSEALQQLRQSGASLAAARTQALADAAQTATETQHAGGRETLPFNAGLDMAAMRDRLQRGALDSADLRALGQHTDEIERNPGIARGELRAALERQQAGDSEPLRQMLEKLARIARAPREEKALRSAQAQVRRSRENLGETGAANAGERSAMDSTDDPEDAGRSDAGGDAMAAAGADRRPENAAAGAANIAGSQGGSHAAGEGQPSPLPATPAQSQPLLPLQSAARNGESSVSSAQVLPRPNRPQAERVEISRAFAPQLEQVLAQEQFPAHYKAYVRRYFLNLSQRQAAPPQPAGNKGEP